MRVAVRPIVLALAVSSAQALSSDEAPVPSAPEVVPEGRPDETPGTRLALWRLEREQRSRALEPYRPGFWERQILALEKAERPSLLDFNVFGIYPRAQTIARGSRTALGARLWHPDIASSPVDVHGSAFFSVDGSRLGDLQAGLLPHDGRRFPLRSAKGDDVYELGAARHAGDYGGLLYGSVRYQRSPRTDFFGLGPTSRREDHTRFLVEDLLVEVVGGLQAGRHVALAGRAGLARPSIGRDDGPDLPATQDRFTDAAAPGLDEEPDFLRLAAQVFVDFRDQAGNPHRGGMLAVQLTRYDDRGGSDAFRFDRFAADGRLYVPLGSDQRVMALRALVSMDDPAPGARVPFYLQETLGGSHTLRGYESFRFRGDALLLLQAEYRWEAWPAVELVLFADAGAVDDRGADPPLRRLRGDAGIGLRVKTFDNLLLRMDVAKSPEQVRFLLRFSPSY